MNRGTETNGSGRRGCPQPSTAPFCSRADIRLRGHGVKHKGLVSPVLPSRIGDALRSKSSLEVSGNPKSARAVGFCICCVQMGQTECPLSSPGHLLANPIFLLPPCRFLISMPVCVMCVYVRRAGSLIWSQKWRCLCLVVSWAATRPTLSAELRPKKFASLSALQCFWMSEPASALCRDLSNRCEFKTNIFHLKCHGRSAKQKRIAGNRLETTAGWSVYSSINSSVLMSWVRKLPLYWWRHGWSAQMRKIVIASGCRRNLESVYLSLSTELFFWRGQ